jgi:hypothetical protein
MDQAANPSYQKQLNKIDGQLSLIIAALNGNPFAEGQGGIVRDLQELTSTFKQYVEDTDKRLLPLEKFKDRIYWTWILVLTGSGVFGACCGIVFSYLNYKK